MKRFLKQAGLAVILTAVTGHYCSAQQSSYTIKKSFPLTGDGKWDYLAISPANGRLYVAHGTEVNIVNKETGVQEGVISNTPGVHGIAFANKYGKGFISNGKENTISVFNLQTNVFQNKIKAGENPDAIAYESSIDRVIVCNGRSKDLTFINPANNEVTNTIALGGKPETAVSDGNGHLYVNLEDKNEIAVVDLAKMTVVKRISLEKGAEPSGLAIDKKNNLLFAGCDKMLVIVNTQTGKVEQYVTIGDGCDGVTFDQSAGLIFCSNGEGTLTVIQRDAAGKYSAVQNLKTQKGAKTHTIDETTGMVYLPVAEFVPQTDNSGGKPAIQPGTFKILAAGR